jgi:hypothetical protein
MELISTEGKINDNYGGYNVECATYIRMKARHELSPLSKIKN